jgi:hypothetical protein
MEDFKHVGKCVAIFIVSSNFTNYVYTVLVTSYDGLILCS